MRGFQSAMGLDIFNKLSSSSLFLYTSSGSCATALGTWNIYNYWDVDSNLAASVPNSRCSRIEWSSWCGCMIRRTWIPSLSVVIQLTPYVDGTYQVGFTTVMNARLNFLNSYDRVYLSKSEDKVPGSVDSAVSTVASGAVSTYAMPNHAVQAFKLLSQNPAAQDVVASIATDPNVWNAFMQNEALKDFMRSQNSGIQFPLMDLKPEESVDDAASEGWKSPTKPEDLSDESDSTNHKNGFITMLQNVKLTVVEMVSSISSFLHNIFSPPAAEKAPAGDASAGSTFNERAIGASFMGLAVMVIMVVLLKRV